MAKVGDKVQIDEADSDYYGRCGIVIGDAFCPTFPYKVEFDDGDDCIFKEKDLIVLSTEEEKVMKFKVGDKVKVSNSWFGFTDEVGVIASVEDQEPEFKYTVKFNVEDGETKEESFREEELELVKEEEKVMKFKVGDKVKVRDSWFGHDGQVGVVLDIDNYEPYNHNIKFDTEGYNERRDENFMGDSLELVTEEEEKVMKFKVGDKVKVKDSWFGFTGEVGLIVRIDGPTKYPYRVKFDVVDEEDEELFAEGSLELIEEKDNYPSLKQAYKSLLEIQKELTTLEESMMRTVRHTRTEIARNHEELAELESKILDAAKQ